MVLVVICDVVCSVCNVLHIMRYVKDIIDRGSNIYYYDPGESMKDKQYSIGGGWLELGCHSMELDDDDGLAFCKQI